MCNSNGWSSGGNDVVAAVRCFEGGSGAAADTDFSILVGWFGQSAGVRIRDRHGGAQERSVPSRNGSVTEAPDGRHNIQAGATLDAAAGAAAGDPGGEDEAPVCIAAVAPDKLDTEFDVDVDPDVPATSGAVLAVCATAGAASAIGTDNTIQNRVAGDSLPVRRDVHRRRLLAKRDAAA